MLPSRLCDAIRLASKHRFRDGRHYSLAAVGVRADNAIVSAINGWYSEGPNHEIHAETRLLRKLGLNGRVFVARVRKDGSVGSAKPCKGCAQMLRFHGAKVWFTLDGDSYGCLS